MYRNLDRLHPHREQIERELAESEKTLFNLDDTFFLYDLTSTYFEGEAGNNPQAKRGYSRDKRPDCKQVLIGLVLNRDGFPKAHEVFDGNRQDRTTVEEKYEESLEMHGAEVGFDGSGRSRDGVRRRLAANPGARTPLLGGQPAVGTECLVGRVRTERQLGGSHSDSLAAQSRSEKITGAH